MPIVIPVPIPSPPEAPQRNDPATFEERNDAAVEYQFEALPTAINEQSEAAYQNALESKTQAETATTKASAAAGSASTAGDAAGVAVAAATQTDEDRAATQADRIATEQNAQATAADRVQTGQDRQAVAAGLASIADGPVYSVNGKTGAVSLAPETKSANFTAVKGGNYWLSGSPVATLPVVTDLVAGDQITFSKALTATPAIQVGAGAAVIQTSKGSDTSVIYDINAEITFVFNGTDWEV